MPGSATLEDQFKVIKLNQSGVNPTGTFEVVSDYQWDTSKLYSAGEVTLIPEPASAMLAVCAVLLAVAGIVTHWKRHAR
jgi:hypothetical protein